MAANEVKLTIRVGDDGSLDVVAKKANKAAKETEKVGKATDKTRKSRENYSKGEKGVAGATSNSTKAFSKMRNSMTGAGGLVPAYATLAANVFAVSAAFGILRRASQVEQLTQGLSEMGRASGLAMGTLAKGLQEATKNALTLEESMRATSMITSAGLDPSMVQQFGEAAQKAAVALGRNTQDSLERFTRGVTKLEPELLDELGLFVRVDEASQDYARALGKNVSQLTNFEKRQAFANATLDQANQKFGSINVDANAYDSLAAAFTDLSKSLLNLLNNFLVPIINFVTGSTSALIGVMALFASSISGQLVGSLADYSEKAKDVADSNRGLTKTTRENLNFFNRSSTTLENLSESLRDGSAATKEYDKAVDGQARSQRRNFTSLQKGAITQEEYTKRLKINKKAINEIRGAEMRQRASSAALAESKAINALQAGRYGVALKNLRRSMLLYRGSLAAATKAQGFFTKALRVGGVALKAFGTAARLAGAAFSLLLGPISLAILAISMLIEAYKSLRKYFVSEETLRLEEKTKALNETYKELKTNLTEVSLGFQGNSQKITSLTSSYIAYGNSLSTVLEKTRELGAIGSADALRAQAAALQEIIDQSPQLQKAFKTELGTTQINQLTGTLQQQVAAADSLIETEKTIGLSVLGIKEAFKTGNIAAQDFFTNLQPKTTVDQLSDGLREIVNATAGSGLKDLDKIIAEQINENAAVEKLIKAVRIPEEALPGEQLKQDLIAKKDALIAQVAPLEEALGKLVNAGGSSSVLEAQINGYATAIQHLNNRVADIGSEQQAELDERAKGALRQRLVAISEIVDAERTRQITAKNTIKTAKEALDLEKETGNISLNGIQKIINKTNDLLDAQIDNIEGQINFNNQLIASEVSLEAQQGLTSDIKTLEAERAKLLQQRIEGAEVSLQLAQAELAVTAAQDKALKALLSVQNRFIKNSEKRIAADKQILEADRARENSRNVFRGYDPTLTAQDNLEIEKELLHRKVENAHAEFELKKQSVELEFKLLEAQTKVLAAEMRLHGARTGDSTFTTLANELDAMTVGGGILAQLREDTLATLEKEFEATLSGIAATFGKAINAATKEGLSQTQKGSTTERIQGLGQAMSSEEELPLSKALEGYRGALTPFMEDLAKLGPEGEFIASIAQGAFVVGESWSQVGEIFSLTGEQAASTAQKTQAVASAVGASIGAIGQIMQAQSQAQIAAIDKQIAAEKKRDGKSAGSLATIQKLEKKKEAMQRKSFQQQKKIQMASVVANTAAAIAGAFAPPPIGLGFPAGLGLAAMYAALGAAQLAVISSTSYEGGGSTPSAGAPTSITAGSRRSSVDLAKSQSARGELAYFRGESGSGGPESFTPAFSGYKNRAEGGNTAYMVGEQGPELFVPERPGRIVANDDVSMGAPTNVSFNINTVDSSGVEDLLVAQRGNIIGMIRQAANSYGQDFVEDVDTSVFTQSSGGVSRY